MISGDGALGTDGLSYINEVLLSTSLDVFSCKVPKEIRGFTEEGTSLSL